MHRQTAALTNSGFVREMRRKLSRGDDRQEMRPLAAHEELDGRGATPDYGGTAQHTPDWGDGTSPSHDPAPEEGEPDQSDTIDARRTTARPRPHRPTLKILANTQSPTLSSPDSDPDVLGFLDYTPDPLLDTYDGKGSNPFSRVYRTNRFSELMPEVFVPGLPVHLRIARVQPVHSHIHIFNNHVLVIELEHGEYKWSVERKVRQVATLHSMLLLLRTKLKMPAATRVTRQRRQSMRQQIKAADQEVGDTVDNNTANNTAANATAATTTTTPYNKRLLKFPRKALQTMDEGMQGELEMYLKNLLQHSLFRSQREVLAFFEISPVSFIRGLGWKIKEGYVKKRVGGSGACDCCSWLATPCTGKYKQQWLVLKETCLFFLVPESGLVRTVILMDSAFQVSHSYRLIGARNSLLISNQSRSLLIKCDSESSQKEWLSTITKTQRKYGKDFTNGDNRYLSFAPVRKNSYARWYVDGARYMWDVADLMETAKEEIFITDWWMCPQIYLKRPDLTGSQWRLSEVLRRKAESGVRIFIMLYKEVELALGISSLLTKQTVNQLHPNIKVLRHPDHIAGGVLYWAHHEKVVVVDQMFAFVSGIDLAFGRWDDYRHKLIDIGHAGVQQTRPTPQSTHRNPGQTSQSRGALQHLLRGTNDVLVSTVTNSAPSSRRPSLKIMDDSEIPLDTHKKVSNAENPNGTVNTTHATLTILESASASLSSAEVPSIPVNNSETLKGPLATPENSTTEVESLDEIDESEQPTTLSNGWKGTVTNLRVKTDMGNGDNTGGLQNGSAPHLPTNDDNEKAPASPTKPPFKKTRFFSREGRDRANTSSSAEEERKEGGGKSFRDVKRRGMEMVEEMKEKGREMRRRLHRRGSLDSDISSSSSDEGEKRESMKKSRTSFSRMHGRRLRNVKERMGSCSSLAQAHNLVTMEDTTSTHLWVGKDYVNWISKDLDNLDEPFKDIVDRQQTPRMPWHDIGLFVEGPAARDVARHFIQRWNAVKTEKAKPNHSYPYLLPRTYDRDSFISSNLDPRHRVKCQVVRSVSKWSAGVDETEASIFSAYVDLIRRAKHFIYIENQFFITRSNVDEQKEVVNYLGYEIVQRIVEAHRKGEPFKVYILLPLLPAFEGMIGKSSGIAMQYIVYWNYVSICKGKLSVIQALKDRGITEWEHYISFCSLRTHECLNERPVSELIYIHSKLMIVDDRFVIAGSANINDRSLNGLRDSEVCLVIEDQEFETGVMNGKAYEAGVFAGSMRRYLFSEHLGEADLENPTFDVSDPVSDAFFINVWSYVANKNTLIYEEVFSCYPCNSATTFEDLDRLRSAPTLADVNPSEAKARLKEVQGHLVQFPLEFLKDEMLKPGVGSKEYLLPMETWT